MPSRVTVVPLFHDLLSTPTNQPASLYDEFGYCFEHARLRKIDSRYSVSAGQLPRRAKSCRKRPPKKHAEADTRRVGGNPNRGIPGNPLPAEINRPCVPV